MKALCFLALVLIVTVVHAQQQPGVDCVPVQGNGWQGCAPVNQSQQPQPRQVPPPTPRWAGQWGSIATDNKLGKLGDFMHGINKESAESLAMLACKINGGTQCKILISF
jgi:hypothetical protein